MDTLTTRDLAERYETTQATISRWKKGRLIPPALATPGGMNGRPAIWYKSDIENWEREMLENVGTEVGRIRLVPRLRRAAEKEAKNDKP